MSDLKKIEFFTTYLGNICIICKDGKLYEVITGRKCGYKDIPQDINVCKKYKKLIEDYLKGKPIKLSIDDIYFERVSPFYQDVYREVLKIPFGFVSTYKEVAKNIGRPKAYRAVATALKKNPFPIFVPCHRVIRSDRKIGGRDKGTFEFRVKLLELERRGKWED